MNLPKTEEELAEQLAQKYRREGYEVIVEPGPKDIPFDLGGYRPDLLVQKGETGFVIEVKSTADRISIDTLSSVADEVRKHPGWGFLLVTGHDVASNGLKGMDYDAISLDEISNRIDHARRLEETGDSEAAFLIFWISLEKLLRFQAIQTAIPVERLSPSIIIRQLYSRGELSIQQFDAALECLNTRNRLIHGFRVGDLETSTHRLKTLVIELLAEWSSSTTLT